MALSLPGERETRGKKTRSPLYESFSPRSLPEPTRETPRDEFRESIAQLWTSHCSAARQDRWSFQN
eukprot:1666775-Rhodomonas_salina.5